MPKKKPVTAEDIYRLQLPGTLRLSPKGDRLVVAVGRADKEKLANLASLWLIDLRPDGAAPRQFTQGKWGDGSPRWSPDGKSVAFVSNRSGKAELWVIPADGGEARQLTKLEGGISDFEWHPKGRSLVVAFTAQDPDAKDREARRKKGEAGTESPRVREISRLFYKLDGAGFLPSTRTHLWLIDAETGKAKQLTEDDHFDEGEPRFSPDGKWVYFASNRMPDPDAELQRIDLWRVPTKGGRIEKVKTFDGPSSSHSLSPDGRWIAFLGKRSAAEPWNMRHDKLWLVPSEGGKPIDLTERLDRSIGNSTISDTGGVGATSPPIWSPDSKWVYFQVTNEGSTEVWRVAIKERKPEPVVDAPGLVTDFALDLEGGWVHTSFNSLTNPGEVISFPIRSGKKDAREKIERTRFNQEYLSERVLSRPEEYWLEGGSRNKLQGWVLNPPGYNPKRKYPGILYIHGGPATQYGRAFFHEFQVLAASGYVVLYSNPRGGTGYSEKHLNAIVNRWGTYDYDDLMTFTDFALKKAGHLDRKRLCVAGGSYGGFMTNWIIGHTDRFACAMTQRSISNLLSFVGSSDFGYFWPREFGSAGPWEDPKHYLAMSPLTYLSKMKTPTLIEHQEEDHRCPVEQAEQLWAALKSKGVPCEFVRYPGEPHGMSRNGRPDRRIDRLERNLRWMKRWLKK
ncbi:MAG: S9 family peptidase [Candidatus Eisenbacteria bacterium]|nr:S9 family peptidase [Candidatus Eisenbacteria bacterium]